MGNTIYASFADPSLAEKAAGALLDHGVRPEDISVVRSHNGEYDTTNYGTTAATSDATMGTTTGGNPAADYNVSNGNTVYPTGGIDTTGTYADRNNGLTNEVDAAGNRIAETGDRAAGWATGEVGADRSSANYEAAADRRDAIAHSHDIANNGNVVDANDIDAKTTADYDAAASTTGYGSTGTRVNDTNYPDRIDDTSGDTERAAKAGFSTTTGADAGAGAVKGAAWGLGLGVVAALASLIVPGVGLVLGGGALAAAIGGVAATTGAGAAAGAITGYLKDQGVEGHVAEHYEQTVAGGGAILAVSLPSGDVSEAEGRDLLAKYGATNINAYSTTGGSGYVA